ncbi:MAG: glutathione S-transferase family protein [Rhodospirillaceae bacterium]|jgi:glutathione S-transferase|nr:glutathione S-transferase family protein [Rhodospirillaceae bacterium]MBT5195821.1 glutathione S-transferase family protein [Rhodospirillaceae bacterium]MBT6430539.1 glutathione S-transferase family protein [Rhodospirillaceae bacterium]
MTVLKVYGVATNRTMRTTWMANELGLEYELIETSGRDGSSKSPEFLAINPNGSVPAIQDDGHTMWESLAINLYLAKKHGGELAPKDDDENGLVLQWSFWAAGNVEMTALDILFNRMLLPEDERNAAVADAAEEKLAKPLAVLNGALADRDYLVGDRFTVADLNVAAIMSWVKMGGVDMSAHGNVTDWLGRCLDRPAFAAARGA